MFQSVILAGVYDVRNISRKIRPEEDHKENSPWNIAADFLVEMNFSVKDIEGMLSVALYGWPAAYCASFVFTSAGIWAAFSNSSPEKAATKFSSDAKSA